MGSVVHHTLNTSQTQVLSNSDTVHKILASCDTGDLTRIALVNRAINAMLRSYMRGAYRIDRLLARYFPHPDTFRILQRQTASLISGSQALHFFDRTYDSETSLDLFLFPGREREVGQYLLSVGYLFVPTHSQLDTLSREDERAYGQDPLPFSYPQPSWDEAVSVQPLWDLPGPSRGNDMLADCGVDQLYQFVKKSSAHPEDEVSLRLFVTRVSPMASILLYNHSTALMNVISHDMAYTLYPYATFIARQQLPIGPHDGKLEPVLQQYLTHGWESMPYEASASVLEPVERWVDDQDSWVIGLNPILDHKSATLISASGVSRRLPRDPVSVSGWLPSIDTYKKRVFMSYNAVVGNALHYSYIIPMSKRPRLALEATKSVNEILTLWGQLPPQSSGPTFADEQVMNSILDDRLGAGK